MTIKIKEKTVEERYQKLSPVEHILLRPHMYIGDVKTQQTEMFVVENHEDPNPPQIVYRSVGLNPGFVKVFDEILTNASDHAVRTGLVRKISVTVTDSEISVENDGPGIPVVIHKGVGVHTPEMLLADLHTGENFNESEEREVGGMNGLGAKLTNIYSSKFTVDTADGKHKYIQTFFDNMSATARGKFPKPDITTSKKNYTRITYTPDFVRFGMSVIGSDHKSILLKRVLDVAVYCPKVKVSWNGTPLKVGSFQDYMKLHLPEGTDLFYERVGDRWDVGVARSEDGFRQVSMVNGLTTYNGGTHVNHLSNQLVNAVREHLTKGSRKDLNVRAGDVRSRLFVFLCGRVPNPTFTNQSKDTLTTRMVVAVAPEPSEALVKKVIKSDVVKEILELALLKEQVTTGKDLLKAVGGGRPRIKKLDDANRAGKSDAKKCSLFIAEGDSAGSMLVAGFSVVGRDHYGVFPVKGKPLNVRDVSMAKIRENEELRNIIAAMGLEFGKKYTSTDGLRYGKLVVAADADCDGNHIKGLLINIFDVCWPELLALDFLYEFVTPIGCARRGKEAKYFYGLADLRKWSVGDTRGWQVKYYKGLGTIRAEEARMFFRDLDKHLVRFHVGDLERERDQIDMVFRGKRAEDRKDWLLGYVPGIVDKFARKTTYGNFIDEELVEFSMADNVRSIPSVVDGLKPSQRKILYTMLSHGFKGEVNVSELFGYVKATAAYHHGPASLEGGIVGMAQDFVGSNNLNLLLPNGSFGTRIHGGKDSAAARYIFTELSPLTKLIFCPEDEGLLIPAVEDGKEVEPTHYLPVIPMLLVNGCKGVGTGWSTDVPMHDPTDVLTWVEARIQGKKVKPLTPSYRGFRGTIAHEPDRSRFVTRGIVEVIHSTKVTIRELPVGRWNTDFYDRLDDLVESKTIHEYTNLGTDTDIHVEVKIPRNVLSGMGEDEIVKLFDLETVIPAGNMFAFDRNGKIRKYASADEIAEDFYEFRLGNYTRRREYLLEVARDDMRWISGKVLFVKHVLADRLKVMRRKRDLVEADMEKLGLERRDGSYDYLLGMSLVSLTAERLAELKTSFETKEARIRELESSTPEALWLADLAELKVTLGTTTSGSGRSRSKKVRKS